MSKYVVLLLGVAGLSWSLDVTAAPAQALGVQAGSNELPEIVVTAERREERIQRVGATITALTGAELQSARITQPADIANLTPGLSTLNRTADDAPSFSIRGVGLDDYTPNNSSGTAVYYDGVYETGPIFLSFPIFDVSRVEVLKGPQGTLYGKNATGGAISLFAVEPGANQEGFLTAGYGRYSTLDVRGAGGASLNNALSFRLSGTLTRAGEGFQTDVDTGKDYGRPERYAGRLLVKYQPVSDFKVLLNLRAYHDGSRPSSYEHDMTSQINLAGVPVAPASLDVIPADPTRVRVGDLDLKRNTTVYGASLTTTKDLGFAALTSILAFDYADRYDVDNNDGVPITFYDYTQDDFARQFYEETRLSSNQSLFGKVNWIVGTSFSKQLYRSRDFVDVSAGEFPLGLFLTPPDLTSTGISVAQTDYVQSPSAFGLFVHTDTSLTDRLRVLAGARFSSDRAAVDGKSTEVGSANGGILFNGYGSTVAALKEAITSNRLSWKIGLEYDVTKRNLFYATVSTGTKSAVFALPPALDPASWRYVKPETLLSYEVGLKNSFLGNRVIANISAFYYDYHDRQTSVAFISPITGSFATSESNLPQARIEGIDFDGAVHPFQGLTVGGGYTYLDSRVTKTITQVSGEPLVLAVQPGDALAQAPRTSFVVHGAYNWRLTRTNQANVQLNYTYTAHQIDALGDPAGQYGPDDELTGRISVVNDTGWELAAWGRNLTDNRNLLSAYLQVVGRTIYLRPPISYGIEATRHF